MKKRADLVAFIDSRLERIGAFKRYAKERESLALGAEARSFSLPPVDATDKLLRYEAHLDRQLYRAMVQLGCVNDSAEANQYRLLLTSI